MTVRIVLVGTTHPGNIGAAARAMKNMGLDDLVLVSPRHFPHDEATARASGAEDLLARARVVESLDAALEDCGYAVGASARSRTIGMPVVGPRDCAPRIVAEARNAVAAVIFGPEKSGLRNEDLDRCHALLSIPAVPEFSSLNLAMAVQVVSYELRLAAGEAPPAPPREMPLASGADMQRFYEHLERVLTDGGFLDPANPRYLMRRLRRLFARAEPDVNEINILRGILATLEEVGRRQG